MDVTVTDISKKGSSRTHRAHVGDVTAELDEKGTVYVYLPSGLLGWYSSDAVIVPWPELRLDIATDVVNVAHALRGKYDSARLHDRIRRLRNELATLESAEVTS